MGPGAGQPAQGAKNAVPASALPFDIETDEEAAPDTYGAEILDDAGDEADRIAAPETENALERMLATLSGVKQDLLLSAGGKTGRNEKAQKAWKTGDDPDAAKHVDEIAPQTGEDPVKTADPLCAPEANPALSRPVSMLKTPPEGQAEAHKYKTDTVLDFPAAGSVPAHAPIQAGENRAKSDSTPDSASGSARAFPSEADNGAASVPAEGKPQQPGSPNRVIGSFDLMDYDVRKMEFKTEIDMPAQPLSRFVHVTLPSGDADSGPKSSQRQAEAQADAPAGLNGSEAGTPEDTLIPQVEEVQRVHLIFEPPQPPPVARQLSVDVGEEDSAVRIVIRERLGQLSVRLEAADGKLREDLENAAPQLLHELRRENPNAVRVDFMSLGSATDAEDQRQPREQRKKVLKPEAVFADGYETAYLAQDPRFSNSL